MKLRRLFSLLLCVMMIASLASVCIVNTSAAETNTADTGAKLGNYYNVDYLEAEAEAYLATQDDMTETNLGATYTPQKTTWRVWSPTATKVQLKLYTTGSDMESGAALIGKYDMVKDAKTSVWSYTLTGDQKNVYYTYLVTNPGSTNETFDIYAKAAGINGDRSMVVDLDSTDPDGWDKDEHVFPDKMTENLIWEGHIVDMTYSATSGVDKNYQGKFLGFAEGGLTINGEDGAKSVGIDYLVEQGIKAVHIQCPFDFASGDENNPDSYNWGYDPKNYNLPEGMYSTNPYDGNVRIKEFKQLIQALHDRGISVIIGVVYNHTYVTDQSAFSYTVPGYYYRMESATKYVNGSACGNTLASDKAMFRSYMMQSLKYWVEEYHVDGFRFDLMACHDTETMNMIRNMFNEMYDGEGKKIYMYGEPWTGGGSSGLTGTYECTTTNLTKLNANIAGFNDRVRGPIQKAFSGSGSLTDSNLLNGVKGGPIGNYPNQSINYFDCHDGNTWWDQIVYSKKAYDSTDDIYTARLRTSYTYLLTSQGVPFTLAGTEFARSKYGEGNSYNLRDVNAYDWERIETYAQETAYAKGMQLIRSAFSPFTEDTTRVEPTYITKTKNVLAYSRDNKVAGEWSKAIVILNTGTTAASVTLPAGNWTIVANGKVAGLTSLGTASGTYSVEAYGSAVLVQGTTTAVAPEFETITVNHYVGTECFKTSEIKYEVGTTWRATPDAYTIFDHQVTKIESNAGTKDGNCVYGTVTKGQDVTVNIYYERVEESGYITIKYVDEDGNSIMPDIAYRVLEGSEYSIPFKNVAGYEIISEEYPKNFTGTFDSSDPAVVTFIYRAVKSEGITVYYYNSNNWSVVSMYAYTATEDKPLGNWGVKEQRMKKVTDVSELPAGEELGNWYKLSIETPNKNIDYEVSSCKVMFHNDGKGEQEPLNGEAGYDAADTIYVKNKILTFNSKIITSHIDAKTGEKLAEDDVKVYSKVTSNEIYSTSPKIIAGKQAIAPSNASGNLVAGSTCVVYLYGEGQELPTDGIVLGDSDLSGAVNVKDATQVQKAVADIVTLNDNAKLAADADQSGDITVRDATAIQKWVAGISVPTAIGELIPGTGGNDSGDQDELVELYTEASALLKSKASYIEEFALDTESAELQEKAAKFGYDLSKEDTSKNEYEKFDAVLTSVSFYVLNGGTAEEVTTSIETLENAYDWFMYYVTELHTEPQTSDPDDPYSIDVSNGKYPIVPGYNTVVYSAKSDWGDAAYVYCWGDNGQKSAWPGEAMKFALVNDYGENQFVAYIPVEYGNYIINNGNGVQTVDLTVTSSIGMYMATMSGGKYTIGTWEPDFYEVG